MKGKTTALFDPKDMKKEPKSFAFDHSYWSHDGCKPQSNGYMAPDGSKSNYTDQVCLVSCHTTQAAILDCFAVTFIL